jgi:hypothetical protein
MESWPHLHRSAKSGACAVCVVVCVCASFCTQAQTYVRRLHAFTARASLSLLRPSRCRSRIVSWQLLYNTVAIPDFFPGLVKVWGARSARFFEGFLLYETKNP